MSGAFIAGQTGGTYSETLVSTHTLNVPIATDFNITTVKFFQVDPPSGFYIIKGQIIFEQTAGSASYWNLTIDSSLGSVAGGQPMPNQVFNLETAALASKIQTLSGIGLRISPQSYGTTGTMKGTLNVYKVS